MLKTILAATDGSDASARAVTLAGELAAKFKASLVLLYVMREMQLPERLRRMAEIQGLEAPRESALKAAAEAILDDARQIAARQGARSVETVMRSGDPADCIVQFARVNGVDLIVMGSRGLGDVKGMLLGSVSRKVSNLSEVSCLTVR